MKSEYPEFMQHPTKQQAILVDSFPKSIIKTSLVIIILCIFFLAILLPANAHGKTFISDLSDMPTRLVPSSSFMTENSRFPIAAGITYSVSMILPPIFGIFSCFARLDKYGYDNLRSRGTTQRIIWLAGALIFSSAAILISPTGGRCWPFNY